MSDVYVVMWADGCLRISDMSQCKKERWVPIASLKQDGKTIIPCFTTFEIAKRFSQRNYPREWVRGIIAITRKEMEWMGKKGWLFMPLNHPRLFKDRNDLEFGYEVLEFQTEPDLFV